MAETDKRILAFDVGTKRVGVAVSDPTGTIGQPVGFIENNGWTPLMEEVVKTVGKYSPCLLLVGLPINMDGSRGAMANKCDKFASLLREKIDIPLLMIDERLTSSESQRVLLMADVSRKKRKQVVDGMAASLILQKYLQANLKESDDENN